MSDLTQHAAALITTYTTVAAAQTAIIANLTASASDATLADWWAIYHIMLTQVASEATVGST